MNSAIFIILAFLLLSLYLGIRARKGKDMNMEQWSVGGRGFGSLFVFVLLAGETYSIFTLLGTSGLSYSTGGAAYYLVTFTALGAITSYFLLPPVWRYATKHNLVSQSEFFSHKYKSPVLGVFVAVVGVIALVPYIILLFKSMGILVSATSYGAISSDIAIWIGMVVLMVYVMISGIHGSAWTSFIKDIMILFVILFLGIYLPFHYHGGYEQLFQTIHHEFPKFLTIQAEGVKSLTWFYSTVILSVIGYFMWPHNAPTIFAAKSEKTFRTNAIMLPLYALMVIFVYIVGFSAKVQVPGLTGSDADYALLKISMQTFDPWFVGIIGATGLLSTLVPGSMMLMASATMLTKNIVLPVAPKLTDKQTGYVARGLVVLLSFICMFFALRQNDTLATLYLTSFNLIAQLAPSLMFSLRKKNPINKFGAFTGILIGAGIVLYTTFTKTTVADLVPNFPSFFHEINIGLIALVINVIVMVVVSLLVPTRAGRKQEAIESNR